MPFVNVATPAACIVNQGARLICKPAAHTMRVVVKGYDTAARAPRHSGNSSQADKLTVNYVCCELASNAMRQTLCSIHTGSTAAPVDEVALDVVVKPLQIISRPTGPVLQDLQQAHRRFKQDSSPPSVAACEELHQPAPHTLGCSSLTWEVLRCCCPAA